MLFIVKIIYFSRIFLILLNLRIVRFIQIIANIIFTNITIFPQLENIKNHKYYLRSNLSICQSSYSFSQK